MAAIKVFILSIFIFSSSVVMVDCVATMLINNDPVEANPMLQTLGYMIYDLAAMLVWLGRLFLEAVFWVFTLGAKGDFMSCLLAIVQCASSFIYHAIGFLIDILLMPVGIFGALTTMFFDEVGLGTSEKEDGTKYVAFDDVPVFGEVTDGIAYLIEGLHTSVITKLGNPETHEGGLYEIMDVEFREDSPLPWQDEIVIGVPSELEEPFYAFLDPPISFFFDITFELQQAWFDFKNAEIFPFDFLDKFLDRAVDFIMKNFFSWLILEDTYYLYWKGLGMATPNTWLDRDYATPIKIDGGGDDDAHYDP